MAGLSMRFRKKLWCCLHRERGCPASGPQALLHLFVGTKCQEAAPVGGSKGPYHVGRLESKLGAVHAIHDSFLIVNHQLLRAGKIWSSFVYMNMFFPCALLFMFKESNIDWWRLFLPSCWLLGRTSCTNGQRVLRLISSCVPGQADATFELRSEWRVGSSKLWAGDPWEAQVMETQAPHGTADHWL